MTPPVSRRSFLHGSAAVGLTAFVPAASKAAPNERVNLAVVGVRGRGSGLAAGFAARDDAQVTCLCDVDRSVVPDVASAVAERQGGKSPRFETDLRRVLEDKSIDAIVVATPDHWHALATVWGCQAGKHVYVEKPASHNVWEGRKMVEAARKYNRVVQVGTQSRSAPGYLDMIECLRGGGIGKVHVAKAWNSQKRPDLDEQPDSPTPEGVDYNLWLGPAPERPFNRNRFHYAWHWLWDYGTGDCGNDGVHDLDIARWGLGVGLPTQVAGAGDKFANTHWETPDTLYVSYRFPETDTLLVYEQRDWSPYVQEEFENGVAFYGTDGYIVAGRARWLRFGPRNKPVPVEAKPFTDDPHRADFLTCIKQGGTPRADIEEGHRSAVLAHLANITFRVGRALKFDPATESIVGDSEASALLRRGYRKPFEVPEAV
jgi:predicted dehydrogenase